MKRLIIGRVSGRYRSVTPRPAVGLAWLARVTQGPINHLTGHEAHPGADEAPGECRAVNIPTGAASHPQGGGRRPADPHQDAAHDLPDEVPEARQARPEGGPDDACGRAISVSRDREQTLNRYDQDRAPQEEHEIRDDPGHHLPDVGDRSNGACRYDQRYRR